MALFGNKAERDAQRTVVNQAVADKMEERANNAHSEEVKGLLLDGEEVLKIQSVLADYAVVTTERLIFVDGNYAIINKKRKIVSIFFRHIHEVSFNYNDIAVNEVEIVTAHEKYELKMGNKELAKRFAMELMEQMRKK